MSTSIARAVVLSAAVTSREVACLRASVPPAPTLTAVSPDLGDIYAGTPLTLTVAGSVTAVSVGGTACTSVAQDGSTVTCLAPAKSAGTYTVTASNAGGSSSLTDAYEAWHPTVDYPAARVYQADQGTTSAGSATVVRAGVQCTTLPTAWSDSMGADVPLDGQGFVELASGRFLLAGGAPQGHANEVVNTIWYSDDRGKTWTELLPNAAASSTRPAPAHSFGFFTMTIAGTEYVYWLGSDPFTPSGDVFRSADGGAHWSRISTSCPTSGLALYMVGVLSDVIYVIGGQVDINDGAASKTVYKSTDYGITWSALAGASDCPTDVWGDQLGLLPVKSGKLWIAGSGRYDSTVNDFSDAVYTFDGTTWTEVLADGHGQFPPSRYHSVVVDSTGRLWRFNGTTYVGGTLTADTASAHYSDDGATWTELTPIPWGNTHAQAAIATSDGVYLTEGFQSSKVYVIRQSTGALVSAWDDLGSAGLDLAQATDANKPVLATSALGSQPGIVLDGARFMTLSSPDRGLTDGHFEAWFVGKTLNFDSSAAQAGPNPPAVVIGMQDGSSWNNFGFNAGALEYHAANGGWQTASAGSGLADDSVRLYGVTHEDGAVKLWVTGAQVGTTATGLGFDTSWTGWDGIGAGYSSVDGAAIALGAVVVLTPAAASDATFKAKLRKWAAKWGALQS